MAWTGAAIAAACRTFEHERSEIADAVATSLEVDAVLNIIGWFEIVVGVAITGLWATLLATRQVPQILAGNRDIWFHLAAELLTAALLVGSGVWLLTSPGERAGALASLALGALLYTTINSPGYYADRNDWPAVIMFVLLAAATVTAAVLLLAGIA